MWEVFFQEDYLDLDKEKSLIIFKIHRVIADGMSILLIISNLFEKKITFEETNHWDLSSFLNFLKVILVFLSSFLYYGIFLTPIYVIFDLLKLFRNPRRNLTFHNIRNRKYQENSVENLTNFSHKKIFMTKNFRFEDIRKIYKQHPVGGNGTGTGSGSNLTLNDICLVLLTRAVSSAYFKFVCESERTQIYSNPNTLLSVVGVNANPHVFSQIGNYSAGKLIKIDLKKISDCSNMNNIVKDIFSAFSLTKNKRMIYYGICLYNFLAKFIRDDDILYKFAQIALKNVLYLLSNIQGPQDTIKLQNSKEISEVMTFIPCSCLLFSVLVLSYGGNFRFYVLTHQEYQNIVTEIVNNLEIEIERLIINKSKIKFIQSI